MKAAQFSRSVLHITAVFVFTSISALAAAPPGPSAAAIPFTGIGAKATMDYQGDALAVTATGDGARLRCGFQKLEGRATAEGLWLESTANGDGGRLRLVADSVSRDQGAISTRAAVSRRRAALRPVTSPNGTGALGIRSVRG